MAAVYFVSNRENYCICVLTIINIIVVGCVAHLVGSWCIRNGLKRTKGKEENAKKGQMHKFNSNILVWP